MNFGLQTLVALVTGTALLCVIVQAPQLAFIIVMFGLGVPILVVSLTAPQTGTRLNVESRPLAVSLMKVLAIVLVGIAILSFVDSCFPNLRYDLGLPRSVDAFWMR